MLYYELLFNNHAGINSNYYFQYYTARKHLFRSVSKIISKFKFNVNGTFNFYHMNVMHFLHDFQLESLFLWNFYADGSNQNITLFFHMISFKEPNLTSSLQFIQTKENSLPSLFDLRTRMSERIRVSDFLFTEGWLEWI